MLRKIEANSLPETHPAKAVLDQIFSSTSVLLNEKNMKRVGFIAPKPRKFTRLIVTRHPLLPGYVIKTYLDSQRYYKSRPEYEHWISRIEGVKKIRTVIAKFGLEDSFKVPQKWIYRVPQTKKSKDYLVKDYILIEEDMDLLSEKQNLAHWKSGAITQAQLQSLYIILKSVGLRDCATPDNIPFSKDGKIAFIDTQSHGSHVPYSDLNSYLSDSNKTFWRLLTSKQK